MVLMAEIALFRASSLSKSKNASERPYEENGKIYPQISINCIPISDAFLASSFTKSWRFAGQVLERAMSSAYDRLDIMCPPMEKPVLHTSSVLRMTTLPNINEPGVTQISFD